MYDKRLLFVFTCVILILGGKGSGNNPDICSQACPSEGHISCTLHKDADCSTVLSYTSSSWPGAPKNLLQEKSQGGNDTIDVISFNLPDDNSFRKVQGFVFLIEQQGVPQRCIHLDFSGTHWENEDIGKKISVPWECTGMKRSKKYYVTAYSLPLPNVGDPKISDLYASLPPQRKPSRKTTPLEEVHQTAKQGNRTISDHSTSLNSVASTSVTKEDKTITDHSGSSSNSLLSINPEAITSPKEDKSIIVAVTVSVAGVMLCGLILVAVVIMTKKRTGEGLRTKSNGIDVALDNNVEGKSFKSVSVVSPDTASRFSNLGSEHMKCINDCQSLASKEVNSQNEFGNGKEYYYYNLDAKAYPV